MSPIRDIEAHSEPVITPDELAEYLKVSLDTIHRAIRSGTLPAFRIGPRLLRIRTEDARTFLRPAQPSTETASKKRKRTR